MKLLLQMLLMGMLLASSYTMARQRTITGQVTSSADQSTLPGVSVKVKETGVGTSTNATGAYTISAAQGQTLVFSYIGYKVSEVTVETESVLNVQLESDNPLEEVVVIGYGTQKRSDLTGSVVTVKGEQIASQAVSNPLQALSGLTPGVEVLQSSGQPGAAISVRVRGGNSLLGSNEPLYVVDGFPISGSLANINANDILSMDVLKDASATAIYGSRGANGVVMITTKKGEPNRSAIEYHGYYGLQNTAKQIDMLNAREFATLANLRASNDGDPLAFTDSEIASLGEGTNWQDEIFRTGSIQNHSLLISGGTDRTTFGISGNYLDQEGIIINSRFQQMQLRNTIRHQLFEGWNISLNTIVNRTKNNILRSDNTERGSGVLSGALVAPPTVGVYNPDGTYTNIRAYYFSPDIAENPVMNALERVDNLATRSDLLSNAILEGRITKDLVLRSSVGVEYANSRADYYSPTISHRSATGDASIGYDEVLNVVNENTLTYSKRFREDHELNILGGITSQQTTEQGVVARATGFQTDLLQNLSLQSGNSPGTPTSYWTKYSILSGLGRINYSYKGKYLLTASLRADGSSRFGNENKWGYFPSAAAAWRVSDEGFWSAISPLVNDFKIRASWGKTGNTSVAPYQSLALLQSLQTVFDNNIAIGFAPGSTKPNPLLKWETTSQVDAGIDAGLWNNRLTLAVDYYYKKTSDLLTSSPVPLSTGYLNITQNVGSIENKGVDISLNAGILERAVKWDMGVNFSLNRNKVLELSSGTDIFGETLGLPLGLPANLVREGYPVGVFYGYVEDGLTATGDINFVDLDNNGAINALDRTIIGDPNPDFILGLNSSLSYQNFSLSFLLNWVKGNDILNYNASNLADGFSFGINQVQDVIGNYWTPENPDPNAKYPRISSNTRYLLSDRFVEDGSYVRLRNVQLAYTFPSLGINNFSLAGSQVYIAAQNLLTFTNYSFYSPEVNTRGGGISRGVDQFGYPDARTFMLGLRLKF